MNYEFFNRIEMKNILFAIIIFSFQTSFCQSSFHEKKIPKKISVLCDSLVKIDKIEGRFIGVAGSQSESWMFYEKLRKKTSSKVLFELTNHPNHIIRYYSFQALLNKKSKLLIKAIKKNENDTIKIRSQSGCIIFSSFLIEQIIESTLICENIKYWLDPKEIEYLTKLSEKYSKNDKSK